MIENGEGEGGKCISKSRTITMKGLESIAITRNMFAKYTKRPTIDFGGMEDGEGCVEGWLGKIQW